MSRFDLHMSEIARGRSNLVTRAEVLAGGGTDHHVGTRVAGGRWVRLHAGVYTVGAAPLAWRERLAAALLAAGAGAAASHRAALVVWRLDGISAAPVELTVPYSHDPCPAGVVVHRTRRPVDVSVVDGLAVTSIDRTLLDAAGSLPAAVVDKALDSAWRRRLTTPARLALFVEGSAGRGVRGTRVLRELLSWRVDGRAAGSAAEVELLRVVRMAGVEPPVRQFEVRLPDGSAATLDVAWPGRMKAIEIDGLDAHGSAAALEQDLARQNALLEAGWRLRRYSARTVVRTPDAVAAGVVRFLAA